MPISAWLPYCAVVVSGEVVMRQQGREGIAVGRGVSSGVGGGECEGRGVSREVEDKRYVGGRELEGGRCGE